MMAKKAFNLGDQLADVLGNVSESDTAERLIYIPYDKLVVDAENGYSMNGVDELARSIEIVGLLQPLRVYEIKSSGGLYRITSGHRRHAAIGIAIKNGSKRFEGGVPCVEDVDAGSVALRELKLLLANADNRKLTPADEAQQAERISDCLRRLEDEGFQFAGRHRDWVAKLSGMSRTKIATLDAIRNNLVPELLEYFKKNEISQSAAYELQKLPAEGQKAIADSCKRTGAAFIKIWGCEHCVEHAEQYMAKRICPNGDVCDHHAARFVKTLRSKFAWAYCDGDCCLTCRDLDDCDHACKKAKGKKAEEAAKRKKKKNQRELDAEKSRERANREHKLMRQKQAQRILPLIEKAGLSDKCELPGNYAYTKTKVAEIRRMAAGDFGDKYFYDGNMLPTSVEALKEIADRLGCSLDYLAGRTDDPTPSTPAMRLISVDESYPAEGQYVIAYTKTLVAIPSVYFRARFMDCTEKSVANIRLTGIEYWSPRPQLPVGKKWPGQETIEGMVKK